MIDINLSLINKSYGFNNIVLNDIDMTIQKGEKVGLIGSNGCGKSTLLKIIAGKEVADSGIVSIRKGVTLGYLSQIPEESDILIKDYINSAFKELLEMSERLDKLQEKLENNDLDVITKYTNLQEKFINMGGYEYQTKIQKILPVFNITDEMLERNFNTLSGGEKTIVSLVRLLLQEPDILLLDEATNHLDIARIEWLEKFLKNYKGTVVVVSHDRYFMDNVVNKIFLITKRGIESYFGNYSYYIVESENRLIQEFNAYKNQKKQIEAMEKSIKRLQEYGKKCGDSGGEIFFRRAESIRKRLEKMEKLDKPDEKKNININFNGSGRSGHDVLTINKLDLSFDNKVLFNKMSLNLYYKDFSCLVGENGCGKSTLIREILKGNPSIRLGTKLEIGYIPQEIVFENEESSIFDEARKYFIGYDEQLRAALVKYLFGGENIYKKIKYLSGGERVRLRLFCLMQKSYNFLILDEPTNHIDIDTREILENALLEFDGTVLFVSHDRYFINKISNNILEIKNNKIFKHVGNYDDYRRLVENSKK